MSSKSESVIWSHDTGQQIPCFYSCQLTITWIFNIIYVQLNQGYDLALVEYGSYVSLSWRRWEHVHTINATNHVGHGNRVVWFSISMHACDCFYSYGALICDSQQSSA